MQFNTDGPGSELQSEINITPLVDVVLVLLIIFMVVVPLLLKGYDVGIPKASAETAPAEADESQVVLSIGSDDLPGLRAAGGARAPRELSREPGRARDPCGRAASACRGDPGRPACGPARVVPRGRRTI